MIRRQFFIKPKLQFKYMAITAAIVILSAVVVYVLLHQVLRSSGGMEQLTTGEWHDLRRALDRSLVMIIGFIAIVLAVESIFFFHRLVGPLYVFEKVLRSVKEGDLTQRVHLRQGDEFKEVAAEYNGMAESLSVKISEIRAVSDTISGASDGLTPEAKEAAARLRALLSDLKTK